MIIHQKNRIPWLLSTFITEYYLSYNLFILLIVAIGKDIGRFYKYDRSKISTPIFRKPALSSSSNYTSYTTSLSQTIISSQLENKDSTAIQNTSDISNTDYIQSCVTPQKQNYSVQATSTTTCLTPLITTLPLAPFELTKTTELPPVGK